MSGIPSETSLIFFVIIGVSITFAESSSFANVPKAPEIYTATESYQVAGLAPTGVQVPITIQAEAPQLTPNTASPAPSSLQTSATAKKRGTHKIQGELSPSIRNYDAVPLEQVEPFMKRMRLVEELIEKYGRAYDYRTHTVRDLEVIRAQLEAEIRTNASKSTHVAPAVPAVPMPQGQATEDRPNISSND